MLLAIQRNSSHSPAVQQKPLNEFLAGAAHSRLTQSSCLTTAWATVAAAPGLVLHAWTRHLSLPDTSRWDTKKDDAVIT